MYKVGIIGDFENVAYFGAIGMETFSPKAPEDTSKIIERLAKNDFAVIFVSEKYYSAAEKAVQTYADATLPAIVPLPCGGISQGIAREQMKQFVERAVGSDIIFDN
ncbi:MAG: V-type ATP synthase subunit F [Firmicutes bacterium]|nr:V-type ATP synthase subunit F [Bacillota bacterium]